VCDDVTPMEATNQEPPLSPPPPEAAVVQRPPRRGINVMALVVLVILVLIVLYVSLSDGIDYVHGFGNACLVVHDGWHFHASCGSVNPPSP
jgi:hypothetical protein